MATRAPGRTILAWCCFVACSALASLDTRFITDDSNIMVAVTATEVLHTLKRVVVTAQFNGVDALVQMERSDFHWGDNDSLVCIVLIAPVASVDFPLTVVYRSTATLYDMTKLHDPPEAPGTVTLNSPEVSPEALQESDADSDSGAFVSQNHTAAWSTGVVIGNPLVTIVTLAITCCWVVMMVSSCNRLAIKENREQTELAKFKTPSMFVNQ